MTAFSMEPDSGESKSAPGESLDEEWQLSASKVHDRSILRNRALA